MPIFIRLAAVVVAASLAACAGIHPASGPGVTNIHHAGFGVSRDCITRDVAITDPNTGAWAPVRERFCGGPTQIAE